MSTGGTSSGRTGSGAAPVGRRLTAAAATLAVTAGLSPVVSGGAWLVDAALAVVLVAVAGLCAARLRAGAAVVVGVQLATLVLALTVVHVPAQAVWGLLPGPAVWEQVAARVGEALEVVRTQAAPITGAPGLRLVLAAGAGVLAVLVDAVVVGARRPALAGLPLLVVHAVAVVFAPGGLSAGWFVVAAVAFAALLVQGRDAARGHGVLVTGGGRRAAGAASSGGLAPVGRWGALGVAGGVLLAVAVPAAVDLDARGGLVDASGGAGPGGSTTYLNPLLDLRDDLGARQDTVVLRYTTEQARPEPLRIVTVDSFDGDVWEPSSLGGAVQLTSGGLLPAARGTTAATPAERYTATVTVEGLDQQWLPLPYAAERVRVDGQWVVYPDSLNVIGAGGERTEEGQQYEVTYRQAGPTAEALAAAPAPPEDVVARYAQLPTDLPPIIAATAQEVVAGAGSGYDEAVALQEWFRSEGDFRYTLSAPEAESDSALADFLGSKEGYCTHFASTMAVMARSLGIPARVAVGFLPGSRTGDGEWEISVDDAHAWPELYFEGAGWLRFEPTPGSRTGDAPEWTSSAAVSGPEEGPTSAPSTAPTASAAPTAPGLDPGEEAVSDAGGAGAGADRSAAATAAVVVAAAAGAVGVLLLPRAVRGALSRRRWQRAARHGAGAPRGAEAAWADLVERVGDLGVAVPASATPRQVGRLLEGEHARGRGGTGGVLAEPLRRLVAAVERSRYGSGGDGPGSGASARGSGAAPSRSGAAAVLTRRVGAAGPTLRDDALAVVSALADGARPAAARRGRWWPASGRRALLAAAPALVAVLRRRWGPQQ